MISAAALADLVASLLVAIAGYTGYAIPAATPEVLMVPHPVLEDRVCGRPCPVLGFTAPDGTILIDDRLAIDRDPAATSILVHELTHFLQRAARHDHGAVHCEEWVEREHEAYDVQYRWLRDTAHTPGELYGSLARLGHGGRIPTCRSGGDDTQ